MTKLQTAADHPEWAAALTRMRQLGLELAALNARQNHLRERLKNRPDGVLAMGQQIWNSGATSTAAEDDSTELRQEFQANSQRLGALEAAQSFGASSMHGFSPMRISRECCVAAAPIYLESMKAVRDLVLQLKAAMIDAEDILTELEIGSTEIIEPLSRSWGPIGNPREQDNVLISWIVELNKLVKSLERAASE